MMSFEKWKIDTAEELPLAIIEDTSEGHEVFEFGERIPSNILLAKQIVKEHNAWIRRWSKLVNLSCNKVKDNYEEIS